MTGSLARVARPRFLLLALALIALLWLAQPLALGAIAGYQRFVSPRKGFVCAHRARWQERSCSSFAADAIRERGLVEGLFLLRARFEDCRAAQELLQRRVDGSWSCQGSHCGGAGSWRCG